MSDGENKALVPVDLDDPLVAFGSTWERGNELVAVLRRLPGEVVLKSGLAARRKKILERWDALKTPTLDGEVPEGAQEAIEQWVHDAKVIIGGIVRIGTEQDEDEAPSFAVIERLSEADWISDSWCWPWDSRALATTKKKSWNKEQFVKAGVLGAIGLMAFVALVEEEE